MTSWRRFWCGWASDCCPVSGCATVYFVLAGGAVRFPCRHSWLGHGFRWGLASRHCGLDVFRGQLPRPIITAGDGHVPAPATMQTLNASLRRSTCSSWSAELLHLGPMPWMLPLGDGCSSSNYAQWLHSPEFDVDWRYGYMQHGLYRLLGSQCRGFGAACNLAPPLVGQGCCSRRGPTGRSGGANATSGAKAFRWVARSGAFAMLIIYSPQLGDCWPTAARRKLAPADADVSISYTTTLREASCSLRQQGQGIGPARAPIRLVGAQRLPPALASRRASLVYAWCRPNLRYRTSKNSWARTVTARSLWPCSVMMRCEP